MGAAFDRGAATRSSRALRLLLVAGAATVLSTPAWAQTTVQPPLAVAIDQNGVNLATGDYEVPASSISIGPEQGGVRYFTVGNSSSLSNYIIVAPGPNGGTSGGPLRATVSAEGTSYQFTAGYWEIDVTNQWAPTESVRELGGKATLVCSNNRWRGRQGTCTLTTEDGTTAVYDLSLSYPIVDPTGIGLCARLVKITRPDGEVVQFNTEATQTTDYVYFNTNTVWSSLGWMLKFGTDAAGAARIDGINISTTYCDPAAASCATGPIAPYVTSSTTGTMSTSSSSTTTLKRNGVTTASVVKGSSWATVTMPAGDIRTYSTSSSGNTSYLAVSVGDSTWNYKFDKTISNSWVYKFLAGKVTNPDGYYGSYLVNTNGQFYSVTDENLKTTLYQYSQSSYSNEPVERITPPEGTATAGYVAYTYDSSRRPITETSVPKTGSTLPSIVRTWVYDCATPVCRNKPTRYVDGRNNATDYTYDTTHGGMLTETGPADANGVRPQTRYHYSQFYPKVKDASGALVNSPPVYRLDRTSTCAAATAANPASCVGTAAETVTTYAYDDNHLMKTSQTVAAGDGSISATTTFAYDDNGALISTDGPLPGTDDKSYRTYDIMGRVVFEIGPDPDGGGGRPRVIVKHNYDANSRDYLVQTGSGFAVDGSDFVAATFKRTSYDPSTGLAVKIEEGGA